MGIPKKLCSIDFETKAIGPRPEHNPPEPVGVALLSAGRSKYMAWGHPSGNNCTRADAKREILRLTKQERRVPVFHNAAFDIEVMEAHLGIPRPEKFEDTLVLAYLHEPRAPSLSLKPICEEWLDMEPEERDLVRDWILENIPEMKGKTKGWGAYIWRAPVSLVGPYAKGDVRRTLALYNHLYPIIREQGMDDWYEEEKRCLYVKLDMEQGGIRADRRKLKRELPAFEALQADLEKGIKRRLGITKRYEAANYEKGFNIGSPKQLAEAMEDAGKISQWVLTANGNVSTSRENLEIACTDQKLVQMLSLHGLLDTYINTFLGPWLRRSESTDGYLYPEFNTVRSPDEHGRKSYGTRTGRPSSSNPNFNNIPASVIGSMNEKLLLELQKHLKKYKVNFIGLRDFLIPDDGCVFINRDYAQQEPRILAHFEDGNLLEQYTKNPRLDVHDFVGQLVFELTGIRYPRKYIKTINFGIIYGMGVHGLARNLGIPHQEARSLKRAVLKAVPGIKWLMDELRHLADDDKPFITWAGRIYYCEEPAINKKTGKRMTFEYKMLNTLIQGSAAEVTKRAMVQVHSAFGNQARVVLQVYDEIHGCAPRGDAAKKYMRLMKDAMESIKLDVPLPTDGKMGVKSWARMKEAA